MQRKGGRGQSGARTEWVKDYWFNPHQKSASATNSGGLEAQRYLAKTKMLSYPIMTLRRLFSLLDIFDTIVLQLFFVVNIILYHTKDWKNRFWRIWKQKISWNIYILVSSFQMSHPLHLVYLGSRRWWMLPCRCWGGRGACWPAGSSPGGSGFAPPTTWPRTAVWDKVVIKIIDVDILYGEGNGLVNGTPCLTSFTTLESN